jgi:ABC-2 type transport system ATP-binding protein
MIQFENVLIRYGKLIIFENLNLNISVNSIYGLCGKNGSGKTTFINAILGLCNPEGGRIKIFGEDPKRNWKIKRQIGVVNEDDVYFPELTAEEFLWWTGRIRGLTDLQCKQQSKKLAELFILSDKLNEILESLSYGTRRKVLLSCAFIANPKLLLLDEPTNGLDCDSVEVLKFLLRQHCNEGGGAIIATHNINFVREVCSKTYTIENKTMVETLFTEQEKDGV